MRSLRGYVRGLLTLLCVVVSVAALINVYGDNADVLKMAKELGCTNRACDVRSVERTPFSQTFGLNTTAGPVTVKCTRSAVLVGEYACAR
jgi:hypothetical protein